MATIVTKNSSIASAVPTTSDLVQGELAVNVTDKRIFTENASTQIVELGTNPSTITTGSATVTGTLTANGTFASNNAVITGGSINSTPIGATTPSTVRGSTVTATTGFVGGLTGNVTGNLTGNVTGNVVGNLTGNVTGNVTASTGTTTLNNLVVNGTADFTNTKLTNITTPTLDSDAANKGYVDATVAAVIDSAPAALDTLNELAAALGDDANFSATVTTALATKLPLAGGTMTGAIAMGTSKITGLGDPTASQDAATKIYVDTADNLKLNLSGGTMSGAIAMGTNKITGLGDPTLAQDAATKAYTDSILGSATSAAASAAAAATSESNAATSASNAATSETNALNSANSAASSYDQFDDRYLGDKASDPTLDNDGNALLTGALYFNTTTDVMRVYTGSAWQDVAISTNSPTFTGTVTADGLSLGDNDKATFGAGNDLEIYHNGSNSFIRDGGTGNLLLQGSNAIVLENPDGKNMIYAEDSGAVYLYHDGSAKLATTSTGIDVTGTATMDGLTVDGDVQISDTTVLIDLMETDTVDVNTRFQHSAGDFLIRTLNDAKSVVTTRLSIDHATGDISFYEDTGTTAKFFWDASAESLGIGTTSPARSIHVAESVPSLRLEDTDVAGLYGEIVQLATGDLSFRSDQGNVQASTSISFSTDGTEKVRIDSSGNVGIGTSTPSAKLTIEEADLTNILLIRNNSVGGNASIRTQGNTGVVNGEIRLGGGTGNTIRFATGGDITTNERMRIDASGDIRLTGTGALAGDNLTTINFYNTSSSLNLAAITGFRDSGGTNYGGLKFSTTNAGSISERMRIDTSGNVGIGTSSPVESSGYNSLTINDTTSGYLVLQSNGTTKMDAYVSGGTQAFLRGVGVPLKISTTSANEMIFATDNTERLRIDASGNLLVGKTSADSGATAGIETNNNGRINATRDGSISAVFNRLTSDGDIAQFRKDGTTVGSIGSNSGAYLTVGNNTSGLVFLDAGSPHSIRPHNMSTNVVSDDNLDFGASSARFQDIYATNGTIQTSDANEKQDIESLSDAEQRVAIAAKGLLRKFRWRSAVEEKGDDARIHFGIIAQDLQAAFEAEGLDAGRYAMFIHSTWTDEETGEERSRMGVRYSELLAFIIAAL